MQEQKQEQRAARASVRASVEEFNPRTGKWEPAVPLPFYNGIVWWVVRGRLSCPDCWCSFMLESSYRKHWLRVHALRRDPHV